jgi:molecular chaperone HscB
MQWTTQVNEAYRTLKSPVQRAKYLLELNGVDVQFETNTQMPADFLLKQLELREALAEAKRPEVLDRLLDEVRQEKRLLEQGIAQLIDGRKDFAAAAGEVRKLMFLDKLAEEIGLAYEEFQ